jgi:hypothetical protein
VAAVILFWPGVAMSLEAVSFIGFIYDDAQNLVPPRPIVLNC